MIFEYLAHLERFIIAFFVTIIKVKIMESAREDTIIEFIKKLPEVLSKHPELKRTLMDALGIPENIGESLQAILLELKKLREDFNKQILELRKTHQDDMKHVLSEIERVWSEIEKLRNDYNRQFEAFQKRMDQFEEHLKKLDTRMDQFEEHLKKLETRMDQFEEHLKKLDTRMDQFEEHLKKLERAVNSLSLRVTSLGARWGYDNENAVRNAIKGLLEEDFGVRVEKWEYFDEEGFVYWRPSTVEVDVVVKDAKHILIEIKSHVTKNDVAIFLKKSELYRRVTGVEPELMIVTPYIEPAAEAYAKDNKIRVYTKV